MIQKRQPLFQILSCIFITGVLSSGCARVFESLETSRALTLDLMEDKDWQEPKFLEPGGDFPDFERSSARAVAGFDAARTSDTEFWLVGSFYQEDLGDADDGRFVGVARKYQAGSGWSDSGADSFEVIAQPTDDSVDLGEVNLTVSPVGSLLAIFSGQASGNNLWTVFHDRHSWKDQGESTSDLPAHLRAWPRTQNLSIGQRLSASLESNGRALIVAQDESVTPMPQYALWSSSGGSSGVVDVVQSTVVIAEPSGSRIDHPRLVNDREGRTCIFTEDEDFAADAIKVYCQSRSSWVASTFLGIDAFQATTSPTLPATTSAHLSIADTGGYAAVAGPAGEIMVVFYQLDAQGFPNLAYTRILEGTPEEGGPFLMGSEGLPSPYVAISQLKNTDSYTHTHAPALTHLGEGKYLAVVEGVDLEGGITSVFYTTFDPVTLEWSEPDFLDMDFEFDPDFETPLGIQSLQLFSNEAGEAMLAAPWISVVYDVNADGGVSSDEFGYQVMAARYSHTRGGWGALDTFGRPGIGYSISNYTDYACIPAVKFAQSNPESGDTQLASCTLPPRGAVFADGSAVLVYPMQDNRGVFRLATLEFK